MRILWHHLDDATPPCQVLPDMWWSYDPADIQTAIRICDACPVKLECLAVAYAEPKEAAGVWGGRFFGMNRCEKCGKILRPDRSRRYGVSRHKCNEE